MVPARAPVVAVLAVVVALAVGASVESSPRPPGPSSAEAASPARPTRISTDGATLEFGEDFDGTALDAGRWQTCSWWAAETCSIETNDEQELYTPANVSVAGGVLTLEARHQPATGWNDRSYDYTSGMVSTGGRAGGVTAAGFTFTYGYMEARVKVPGGQGLWPAFWTLPADYSWPPEIDVMEIRGDAPATTHMTYHYAGDAGAQKQRAQAWSGPDFSAGWHTFGVDWEPGVLAWYVDGVERWRVADPAAVTDQPAYLVLDLAVAGGGQDAPGPSTTFPADYLVDYVRVWSNAHAVTGR